MTHASVAADFHKTLDIERNLTAEITLHLQVVFDIFSELRHVGLRKILHADIRIDAGLLQDLVGSHSADTKDVGQSDFDALFSGQVNTRNTCHCASTPP